MSMVSYFKLLEELIVVTAVVDVMAETANNQRHFLKLGEGDGAILDHLPDGVRHVEAVLPVVVLDVPVVLFHGQHEAAQTRHFELVLRERLHDDADKQLREDVKVVITAEVDVLERRGHLFPREDRVFAEVRQLVL